MSVDNAHAFLDELKKSGPTPELMGQIGTKFQKEHMSEAVKSRGVDLQKAAGGSTVEWAGVGVAAGAAAA